MLFLGLVAGSAMRFDSMLAGHAARAGEEVRNLLLMGKPVLDLRYRFELVDQDNLAKDAGAHTLRTRAGFETSRRDQLSPQPEPAAGE